MAKIPLQLRPSCCSAQVSSRANVRRCRRFEVALDRATMARSSLEFLALFLAGLLAGEEFVVRFGVRDAIATLDDVAHLQVRQALIVRLRVLVPALFVPALLAGIVATVADGTAPGLGWRCAGVAALVAWLAVTAAGTVPINSAVFDWDPVAPPAGWRVLVDRWERLNTLRCWLALGAFAALLTGVALR